MFGEGFNAYEGLTRSHLANEPPSHTRKDLLECSYYRNYYCNFEGRLIIAAKIRLAAKAILTFAREINSNLMEILGFATGGRFIVTSGNTHQNYKVIEQDGVKIKRRKIGGCHCIGYVNTGHNDKCDKISKQKMISINNLGCTTLVKVKRYFEKNQCNNRYGNHYYLLV